MEDHQQIMILGYDVRRIVLLLHEILVLETLALHLLLVLVALVGLDVPGCSRSHLIRLVQPPLPTHEFNVLL